MAVTFTNSYEQFLEVETVTSLPNPARELTAPQREALIQFLSKHWLESMSIRDLERFFYEAQTDYLVSYSDSELIGEIEDVLSQEDFELLIREVAE